ncbi:MAG: hypothetical protein KF819_35735 [Labilithrix sp.]|nr:hypothetical protein [Labilithrix sp.]
MTMIAGGDERVRNAFRSTLRDEPSRPNAFSTQELDANDILEVHDLAHAIERAERIIRTPIPSEARPVDIFDALAKAPAKATDDTTGPAIPAPNPTPMLPPAPVIFVPHEDDAYYAPAGRMRSLADVTLDGYRPESTLMVRLRTRRRALSWVVAGVVVVLAIVAGVTMLLQESTSSVATSPPVVPTVSTTTIATATLPAAPPSANEDPIPVLDVNNLPSAR